MDTIRANKHKKRNWLIAGSLIAVLIVVFIVICVAITGGDSTETEEKTETEKTDNAVPEAFEKLETVVGKSLDSKDPGKEEVLNELKDTKEKATLLVNAKKEEKRAKSPGKTVTVRVTKGIPDSESAPTDVRSLPSTSNPKEVPTSEIKQPGSYMGPTVTVNVGKIRPTAGEGAKPEPAVTEPEVDEATAGQESLNSFHTTVLDPEHETQPKLRRVSSPTKVVYVDKPNTSEA